MTKNTVVHDDFQDVAIEKKDLSAEQREEIRFQNLTAEQKTAEFEMMKSGLLTSAVNMKSELEILADPTALTQSQTFYNDGLAALQTKYGIT